MKTALKVAGALLLVLLVAGGVMAARVRSQMPVSTGARIDVEPVAIGVFAGPSYVWIVKTAHGAFLVDAGEDPRAEEVLTELKLQGVPPEAVHTVLLTHGHEDHWGGSAAFPRAKVLAGPGDAAVIRGERHAIPAPVEALMHLRRPRPPMPAHLEELRGDETLDLDGTQVKVISVPGHTRGSLAFLVGDVLFTGDSVMARPDGSLDLGPRLFCEDAEQNRRSLEKLREVSFSRIADGHAGVTVDARARLEALLGPPRS
ncbi:MAG TPA: MBL fold metallo-hydrolase [Myxococcales bacterium]|nr:MBL fold metallo-hydrolase [Myxococcales bacterium]